jgi:hypothetical protein
MYLAPPNVTARIMRLMPSASVMPSRNGTLSSPHSWLKAKQNDPDAGALNAQGRCTWIDTRVLNISK